MGYEIREQSVFRDGEKIGDFSRDGTLVMLEGKEDYRLPAAKAVKEFLEEGSLPRGQMKAAEAKPIRTVRELTAAMQEYTGDPCPPFSSFYGDKTPEVQKWIKDHDEIRLNVLKAHNRGE